MTEAELKATADRIIGASWTLDHIADVAAHGDGGEIESLVATASSIDEIAVGLRTDLNSLVTEINQLRELAERIRTSADAVIGSDVACLDPATISFWCAEALTR